MTCLKDDKMTYSESIMQAAREAYIALAKSSFQTGILPKGEACCRAGEYDGDAEMQAIAAAIHTAEQRGYNQAIDDADLIVRGFDGASNTAINQPFSETGLMGDIFRRDEAIADAIGALKKGGE